MTLRRSMVGWLWLLALALPATAQDVQKRQIGQMVLEGVPEIDESLRQRMLQYLEVRRAGLADVADDGQSVLVSTRFGVTNQLHLVRSPLGMRQQITFFDEPIGGGAFVPGSGGKLVLFNKDIGGNENFQIYRFDLASGRYEMLTDGKSRHESRTISQSGKYVAYCGNGRNGRDMDVYVREVQGATPGKIAWEVEGSYYPQEFSPDESKLIVLQYLSERETRVHVLDLKSGQRRQITPKEPPQYYSGGVWARDGKSLYVASDREGEFRKLYRVGVEGDAWTCLTPDINWDIEEAAVDPAGGGIAFVANEDGISKLYLADADGKNRRQVTAVPPGVIGGLDFNHKGGVLGFTLDMATSPGDAYTVDVKSGALTRWTESEVGGLDTSRFVEPQLIRYPTFDQVDGKPRTIPAFVFKGRGDGPRPVVIQPHGGPESQYQPTFASTFQFWAVEMGITVICPNVRGSTGYGRSFHQLDNDVKREDSVKDIGALLDWIATQPDMDSKRVAIFGGSYGGYMVLASLANYPERFKAGIDIVGIASFVSFLERTSEYRRDLRRAEYGDERIPEVRKVLEQISPLNNAEKIKAALFVAHGANDPRVPLHEAQQIVDKMRALGRPVWFANALDEGHGFGKKPNRDLATVLYAAFWQEHLLK